eukprot:1159361-Prorocentrum_minimum.AAC.3
MQTPYRPHSGPLQTPYRPPTGPIRAPFRPHADPLRSPDSALPVALELEKGGGREEGERLLAEHLRAAYADLAVAVVVHPLLLLRCPPLIQQNCTPGEPPGHSRHQCQT